MSLCVNTCIVNFFTDGGLRQKVVNDKRSHFHELNLHTAEKYKQVYKHRYTRVFLPFWYNVSITIVNRAPPNEGVISVQTYFLTLQVSVPCALTRTSPRYFQLSTRTAPHKYDARTVTQRLVKALCESLRYFRFSSLTSSEVYKRFTRRHNWQR